MHLPSGHGGMFAGISKYVFIYHTHVWFTLNTVKSSGVTSEKFDLYATERAQPATSLMLFAWKAVEGWPGHGQSGLEGSCWSPPGPDLQ